MKLHKAHLTGQVCGCVEGANGGKSREKTTGWFHETNDSGQDTIQVLVLFALCHPLDA